MKLKLLKGNLKTLELHTNPASHVHELVVTNGRPVGLLIGKTSLSVQDTDRSSPADHYEYVKHLKDNMRTLNKSNAATLTLYA